MFLFNIVNAYFPNITVFGYQTYILQHDVLNLMYFLKNR